MRKEQDIMVTRNSSWVVAGLITFYSIISIHIPSNANTPTVPQHFLKKPVNTLNDIHSPLPIFTSGMLDRIVQDQYAVILLEEMNEQIVIPIDSLPMESVEGTWFVVQVLHSFAKIVSIDYDRTKNEKEKSKKLREKLRQKNNK